MNTIVYIDGYNLFYGRLRNTPYKWLDPFKLLRLILNNQNPASKLIKVKYFTSPVKAQFPKKIPTLKKPIIKPDYW